MPYGTDALLSFCLQMDELFQSAESTAEYDGDYQSCDVTGFS